MTKVVDSKKRINKFPNVQKAKAIFCIYAGFKHFFNLFDRTTEIINPCVIFIYVSEIRLKVQVYQIHF